MKKLNWTKIRQQNIVNKRGYENASGEIELYKQCTEKQYQLINKLISQNKE